VDDSNIMRRAIEKYASPLGLELVGTAGNGQDALSILQEKKPDLVTLDITMPLMDGLTCLKEMMRLRPQTKVIVISALSDQSTGLKALKLGARSFLPKPFTEKQLMDEIKLVTGELL